MMDRADSGWEAHDIYEAVRYLREIIEPVTPEIYGTFESAARLRLRGRGEDDWPVLASALGLACGVWTEDADFFGSGIAVWTTNRIEIFLKQQMKSVDSGTMILCDIVDYSFCGN